MKILIACEFSGVVREAFRARGHDAVSCDFCEARTDRPTTGLTTLSRSWTGAGTC